MFRKLGAKRKMKKTNKKLMKKLEEYAAEYINTYRIKRLYIHSYGLMCGKAIELDATVHNLRTENRQLRDDLADEKTHNEMLQAKIDFLEGARKK